MDLSLGTKEFTTMHVKGLTKDELPGAFIAPPVWTIDSPAIALITPSADGLNCRIEAATPLQLGTAIVTVSDTDDPSVASITITVTVKGESITHLALDIDPPTMKTLT